MNIELACVCETWFDSKSGKFSKTIKDAGYEIHHAFREKKRGGGAAMIYKRHLDLKEAGASSSQYSSFEYACAILTLQCKRRLLLVCIYRKQEVTFSVFHDELSMLIEKVMFKGDAAMFVGDFNVWVDMEDNTSANQLITLMNAYGLNQQVQDPTHREGHILDQIYLNEFQLSVKHKVIPETLGITTDHFPLLIEIPPGNKQQKTKTIYYRNLKKVNIEAFKNDLEESYKAIDITGDQNFKTLSSQYHNLSLAVVDEHSPILKKKVTSDQPIWIDKEYKNARATRRKFERDWKKSRTDVNRVRYMNQKKLCSELALTKQTDHYSKIIDNAGNCQKSLFKVANELLDKTKEKILPSYSDPKQLANEFNEYFVEGEENSEVYT